MGRFRLSLPPITREWLVALAPIALLVVLALWGAFVVLRPNPPRKVVLLTGTEQGAYAELGYKKGDLPVAEKVADGIMSLPMFPHMTRQDIETVVSALKNSL